MKSINIIRRMFAAAATIGALAAIPTAAAAIGWNDSVKSLGLNSQIGATHSVVCSPGGTGGQVWGTEFYTDDSSICMAAVHAGVINSSGGEVRFFMTPGLPAYQGSSANGVTSSSYGSWNTSFRIVGSRGGGNTGGGGQAIAWNQTLQSLEIAGQVGATHAFSCPGGGSLRANVWGTIVYTSDSSICVAAVHRGMISASAGGTVRVQVMGGRTNYDASSRNGVTSSSYGTWGSSFSFQ